MGYECYTKGEGERMSKKQTKSVVMPDQTSHGITVSIHNDGASEYVELENLSSASQPLAGWVLASLSGGQLFDLPDIVLDPGQVVRFHSGSDAVHQPPRDYILTKENVWSNRADSAILFDVDGYEVSRDMHGAVTTNKPKVLIEEENGKRYMEDAGVPDRDRPGPDVDSHT